MLHFINYDGVARMFEKSRRIRYGSCSCRYIFQIYIFKIRKEMTAKAGFS